MLKVDSLEWALHAHIDFSKTNGFFLAMLVVGPKLNLESMAVAFWCFLGDDAMGGNDFVGEGRGDIFANDAGISKEVGAKVVDAHF